MLLVGCVVWLSVAIAGRSVADAAPASKHAAVPYDEMTLDALHVASAGATTVAVTGAEDATHPNSIVVVDLDRLEVIRSVSLPATPTDLWLSDDGTMAYVTSTGEAVVRQYATATLGLVATITPRWPRAADGPQAITIDDVAVMPGSPNTVAVAIYGPTAYSGWLFVYDTGVERDDFQVASRVSLLFGDAATLYSNSHTTIEILDVGATVSLTDRFDLSAYFGDLEQFHDGRLISWSGAALDVDTRRWVPLFDGGNGTQQTAVDFAAGRAFTFSVDSATGYGGMVLERFDLATGDRLPTLYVRPDGWARDIEALGDGTLLAAVVAENPTGRPDDRVLLRVDPSVFDGNLGDYTPLVPHRILDTRDGTGRPSGAGPVIGGDVVRVQVAGEGGVPLSGVDSVVLNATVTEPTGAGFLTIWPAGTSRPVISNANFVAGQTVANLVTVKLGAGGAVSLFNSWGAAHVIFDVAGFYSASDGPRGARFHASSPTRLFDTREASSLAAGAVGEGESIAVDVRDGYTVPLAGVTAVVLNVTVTRPTAPGFLTVWPGDVERPLASNINFVAGATVPNLVIVRVPPSGIVRFFNPTGSVHVIADVMGYFDDDHSEERGRMIAISPFRVIDTRLDSPFDGDGSMYPGSRMWFGSIDDQAGGYVLNVTATASRAAGFLAVSPAFDDGQPWAYGHSNLNFEPNQTVPNLVVVRPGPLIAVTNGSGGDVHVVVDLFGFFT